ncbi:hypothetical protein D915_011194 [Fasciola hepatica]|uniref:Uncharacterized protein n=1 Tax=Fasciola hepatica TaxID=6192 RepID=A0A4E0QTT5_FASHE|nr:hypothetical protein D915_011194 [Fasciola hepatica]
MTAVARFVVHVVVVAVDGAILMKVTLISGRSVWFRSSL